MRLWLLTTLSSDTSALNNTQVKLDDSIIPTVTNFIAAHPRLAQGLFDLSGRVEGFGHGIGQGEVLLYFIYNDVQLGTNVSSIDIHVSGIPYLEVKTARKQGGDEWVDFRLGTDEFTASHRLMLQVVEVLIRLDAKGKVLAPENFGNIPKSMLNTLRKHAPKALAAAEEAYFAKLFSGRVGSKRFLFFDKATRLPIYYGKLKREQLTLERFSAGQAKLTFNPLA